jgi:predicted nucleic acid-binding protein
MARPSGHDFLDTTYLLAVVNPRDSLFERAQSWARAITERLLVTEYVLCEVVNAYSMPSDRAKAHEIIASVRLGSECDCVSATPALFEAGLQLHAARPDKEWSLTDCISFVVMEKRAVTRALTYDRHFEQAGFQALLRGDPT